MYNEQENIQAFLTAITAILESSQVTYEIICVNDGSLDNTLQLLLEQKSTHPTLRVLNLSRNFGKEAALSAGLAAARGDAIIPIDADLQDPPEVIGRLIAEWKKGFDVVLARRVDRSSDHPAKRVSASLFYKLHNLISQQTIPENVGDFRLISRRVANEIAKLPENQRFLKGLFSWVGFKSTTIDYERAKRHAGTSTFNAWSLWNFALDGLTSFSTAPLRLWLYLGIFFSIMAFFMGAYIVFVTLFNGTSVPGYASMIIVVLFFGGIQLTSIGVLGEYIGRIYLESKRRPSFIVEDEY
jgi:glycosyltransferase involved in cell wall biosynthesis